jgi:hypothetical protein
MLRHGIRLLFLLLFTNTCISQTIDCSDIRQGLYKSHGLYGSLNTIIRTNEKQTETWGKSGLVVEYDIQWTSDCNYILFNGHVLKGNDSTYTLSNKDTIYNEVIEKAKYWIKNSSALNDSGPKVVEDYFMVDTTDVYKDLNEVEKLKDYNGSAGGGTFVGYNYAIKYKQHSTEANKYRFLFLEALIINDKSKFKVLDTFDCTLDSSQRITITNCRFNDKYDKEIAAIFISGKPTDEACITLARRFNKLSLRIEEVNSELVKYRLADKKRIIKE